MLFHSTVSTKTDCGGDGAAERESGRGASLYGRELVSVLDQAWGFVITGRHG